MNSLSQIAWSKFKKDVLGVTALCAIILAVIVSIFGYHIFDCQSNLDEYEVNYFC